MSIAMSILGSFHRYLKHRGRSLRPFPFAFSKLRVTSSEPRALARAVVRSQASLPVFDAGNVTTSNAPVTPTSGRKHVASLAWPNAFHIIVALGLANFSGGCSRENRGNEKPVESNATGQPIRREVVDFPQSLHTADQAVNEFLNHAMTVAAEGDYDSFRLLWSTKTEPLSKHEFDQGWQSVKVIRILAVEKVKLQTTTTTSKTELSLAYLVHARVEFDPLRSPLEDRDAICLIVRERNDWRLANAPATMKTWIRQKTAAAPTPQSG